jgi:niacin transporter
MPPMATDEHGCELPCTALRGLVKQFGKTDQPLLDTSHGGLVCAMLAGRLVFGALNALLFRAGDYSFAVWATAAFVTALPGIVIQLVAIPALVLALQKAKIIEA